MDRHTDRQKNRRSSPPCLYTPWNLTLPEFMGKLNKTAPKPFCLTLSLCARSLQWMIGHLSDEYGRKSFTLLGLFSSASLTMALGFTTNVWVGIASRLLTGALNANFAISRAQIADLVPNGARAMPYAYLGATFALARTFSSGVGGFSVGLFWVEEFGRYMAPCVMLGIPSALTFVLVLVFLPETHANRRYKTLAEARLRFSRFASNTLARCVRVCVCACVRVRACVPVHPCARGRAT